MALTKARPDQPVKAQGFGVTYTGSAFHGHGAGFTHDHVTVDRDAAVEALAPQSPLTPLPVKSESESEPVKPKKS